MEVFFSIVSFAIGFILVIITIPPIIRVSNAKSLFANPGGRNVHAKVIPTLGGIAVFIGFMISVLILTDSSSLSEIKILLVAVIMMFFIGLKDDILIISAWKKLVVQLLASILLVVVADIRFTNFHGIFGIWEVHYLVGVCFTLFVMTVIINAFNLIDGIDGLASGIAIQASTIMGLWFIFSGHSNYAIISFALAGVLCAFFLYNVFGNSNKIFLGDTGALIIGIIISVLIIQFNEFNIIQTNQFALKSAPAIAIAIIIAPLIDTLRVFTIRIIQGRSPFSPDKNHIHHHLLIIYKNNHLKATITIVFVNFLFVAFAFLIEKIGININLLFITILTLGVYIAYIPMIINKSRKSKFLIPSIMRSMKDIVL